MLLYAGSILASVLAFVGFIQSLRWAQLRGADTYAVALINYCLAAVVFFFWFFQTDIPVKTSVVISGLTCGVIYAACFFLLLYCMHWAGVGRTSTTINLAPALLIIISGNYSCQSDLAIGQKIKPCANLCLSFQWDGSILCYFYLSLLVQIKFEEHN